MGATDASGSYTDAVRYAGPASARPHMRASPRDEIEPGSPARFAQLFSRAVSGSAPEAVAAGSTASRGFWSIASVEQLGLGSWLWSGGYSDQATFGHEFPRLLGNDSMRLPGPAPALPSITWFWTDPARRFTFLQTRPP